MRFNRLNGVGLADKYSARGRVGVRGAAPEVPEAVVELRSEAGVTKCFRTVSLYRA